MEQHAFALAALRVDAESSCTRPSVSVPVLSEQSTSMLPKFSMAVSRFTITLRAAMSLAPLARFTLMIAGSSCGVSPTARASANRNESSTGLCEVDVEREDGGDQQQRHLDRKYPKRRSPRSNSVSRRLRVEPWRRSARTRSADRSAPPRPARAADRVRAHEQRVGASAKRRVGGELSLTLVDGKRLARERGLVDEEVS